MSIGGKLANCTQDFGAPVLAVCGFSGSGKTTLLEAAIPHLLARGLSVAVVKHDSHGFVVDQKGKDSDKLFRAGATVALRGPSEQFLRRGPSSALTLEATLSHLARDHDLLLVEGHKDTPLPKLWVGNAENSSPPDRVMDVQGSLPWDSDRLKIFLDLADKWLPEAWCARPLYTGLLAGGKNGDGALSEIVAHTRSGRAGEEANGSLGGATSLNQAVVVLGEGPVPDVLQGLRRLPDAPGLAGPIAGLLAAHRWAPRAAWVLAACDHPGLRATDIRSLVDQRKPGVWAILARQPDDYPCPTPALYEPQALTVLERSLLIRGADGVRMAELFDHPHTLVPKL